MINNIDNPLNAEITVREIYGNVFEYTVEDGFHFESCGSDYGNTIFGSRILTNHYIVRRTER